MEVMGRTETILEEVSTGGIYPPHSLKQERDFETSHQGGQSLHEKFWPAFRRELILTMKMAWPVAISSALEQMQTLIVSVFTGHIGKTQLDATGLGNSILEVGGIGVATGINTACDTLFSQTYGSKNKKNLGVLLQRAILINLLMCVVCSTLFINVGHILYFTGQDPQVTRLTATYSYTFTAVLPGLAILMVLCRYLFAQNIVYPTCVILLISNLFNAGCLHIFLNWGSLDMLGAGMALCLASWSGNILHVIYICSFNVYKNTWSGWSFSSLLGWKEFFSLGLPGLLMTCIPWWGLETFVVMAGLLGTVELGSHTVLVQIVSLVDMLAIGIGTAAAMRVGNYLGNGDDKGARRSAYAALTLSVALPSIISTVILIFRESLVVTFTTNSEVKKLSSTLIPAVAVYHILASVAYISGGVIRGMGRQKLGGIASVLCVYLIALPVGIPMMFKTRLRLAGCWIGFITCMVAECGCFLILIYCTDWKREAQLALSRTGVGTLGSTTPCKYKDYQPVVTKDPDSDSDSEEGSDDTDSIGNVDDIDSVHRRRIVASRLGVVLVALIVLATGIVICTTLNFNIVQQLAGGNCSLGTLPLNISCDYDNII